MNLLRRSACSVILDGDAVGAADRAILGLEMRYRIAVEDIEPDRYVAWALDLLGCFAAGSSQAQAIAAAPARITAYSTWVLAKDPGWPPLPGPHEVELVETFRAFTSEEDPDYIVNAFFEDDRRPLGYGDVAAAFRVLEWARADLMDVLRPISAARLRQAVPGELRGSLAGILEHVASAENWYLEHLQLGVRQSDLPRDPIKQLAIVRAQTLRCLPELIGNTRTITYKKEWWSPRKLLRRTVWHERAHTEQLLRLSGVLK